MPELCYRCGGEGHFAIDCKGEPHAGGPTMGGGRDREPRDYDRRGSDFAPGGFGTVQMKSRGGEGG